MPPLEVEHHVAVSDPGDEATPLERIDVVAHGIELAGRAKRGTKVFHDVPASHAALAFATLEDLVVLVLQVGAVQHHHQHEQTTVRLCAHKRVLLPLPCADALEGGQPRTEPAGLFKAACVAVAEVPPWEKAAWRLLIPHRPD